MLDFSTPAVERNYHRNNVLIASGEGMIASGSPTPSAIHPMP
jgi:hypothetical protein